MMQALANHVWQSTCFAAAIAVCCYWLRHDGAHVRFWLWWMASVKFLVPFSLLTALGARLALEAPVTFVPEIWTLRAELVANPFANYAALSFTTTLLAVWVAGSALLLVRWITASIRLRAVLAAARPAPPVTTDDTSPGRRSWPASCSSGAPCSAPRPPVGPASMAASR